FRSSGGCFSSLCSSFFFSLFCHSNTFLRLLAGQCLGRVVAAWTLGKTSLIQETQNAIGWLCALFDPMLYAIGIDFDTLCIFCEHWVPCTNSFDEAAITRSADVSDHDVVVRTFLRASAGEADFKGHYKSPGRSFCSELAGT